MAPKRAPMEDPPSASSSSEDESEEISDKEDGRAQEQSKENPESEEEESSEDEEDDEEEENKKPSSVQTPNPTETPQPQSDKDSDSETLPSPTASDFTVKPILSKPMADSTTKANKPTSKAPNSGAKRPAESEKSGEESQRKKVKVSNGDAEEKKNPIPRLWSEEDEIVVLKGMIDYQSKKGADPNADMGAFYEFIKKSLRVDVSRNQLMDKVRRLKKKYRTNVEKGEKGEDPVFSKPHEHKSFELSKKIWDGGDNNAVDGSAKSPTSTNKKARKSVKVGNTVLSPKTGGKEVALDEVLKGEMKDMMVDEVKDVKVDEEVFWSMYPRLKESLELEESSYLTMSMPGKSFLKERMSMIGSAKAKDLEEKWKNLREEEVSLYVKRVDLIKQQAKAVLDSMKTSKS
ncbi:DNA-binding storekeeper protein-related transcriptional regulator [Actinidia rufa]|uniref:DNA-binding storekeeper protein-related transcriptional regulator n=1 Tax=Actinidia rufa TaxID=165716 RepID=A0A7J0DBS2_9ERIC|nr:DNA-binding storekeeper protein-related transcriptional regulator [Actinidia rufa]